MKRLIPLFTLLPFISYCQYTAIPDQNFEQALIDLGYDYVIDGQVLSSNINTLLVLDVDGKNITDLTGIEGFTALTSLDCSQNQLTSLDLTQNTALTSFSCSHNQLTSLDVSQNIELESFICHFNQLTGLDLSANYALRILSCGSHWASCGNSLTSLDVSNNTALIYLYCGNNELTSLDVSQNTELLQLYCQQNQLTSLDVSQNTELEELICYSNQLNCLNIANGIYFYLGNTTNNPNLYCIETHDVDLPTWNWTVDPQTSFSENCNYPSNCFSTTSILEQTNSISLYPNPTNNLITLDIEGYNGLVNVEVYDLTGKLLQSITNTTISMGEYAKGIYVFKVAYGDRVEKLKVVKE